MPRSLKEVMDEHEKLHIVRALAFTKGNKRKAIELLKISPDTFYKRLEQFGLHKKRIACPGTMQKFRPLL